MSDNLKKFVELYEAEHNDLDFEAPDGIEYEVVEWGDWEQDGKYQYAVHIVKFNGEYFSVQESRSGSYHTDWYYGNTYIYPVERKEETKVVVSWPATGEVTIVDAKY